MQNRRDYCYTEDGYEITVVYDSSADNKEAIEEIRQVMIELAKEQILNKEEL